jgi:predicted dienelactone hydrolase
MTREPPAFQQIGACGHAFRGGTNCMAVAGGVGSIPRGLPELRPSIASKIASGFTAKRTCDKASPDAAVMLHLRSCYVSKAAILTLPVQLVSVENRSPT